MIHDNPSLSNYKGTTFFTIYVTGNSPYVHKYADNITISVGKFFSLKIEIDDYFTDPDNGTLTL